jgi:hypothetical protein
MSLTDGTTAVFETVLSSALADFAAETIARAPSEDPLGYDVSCVEDIDPKAREVEGEEMMAQAWARRLGTSRGSLGDDDPDYGLDLLDVLHKKMTAAEIAAIPGQIRAELLKDDRTLDVVVKLTRFTPDQLLECELDGTTAAGPFRRTLAVTPGNVALLVSGEG